MLIRALGPIEVEHDGRLVNIGGPQQRRLLAFLLIHRGHAVSTDRIVEALWDEGDVPAGARRSMRTYMSRLRAALPGAAVRRSAAGYALELADVHDDDAIVDIDVFEGLLDRAANAAPDVAVQVYEQALALWRGPPFGELGDLWWALPDATRLLERRHAAAEERCAALLALGMPDRAIADLERITSELPLRERPARLLMQALAVAGRHAEALRVAQVFRHHLAEETGLDPSSELVALEAAILAGDDGRPVDRPLRGYTLHGPIRAGRLGRVYAGTQPGTDREVAIEVISGEPADEPEFVRHFDADARRVARLEHPHIVPLYDFWREPGCAYLVTRHLTGGTLRESIAANGPWPLERVRRMVDELGGALAAARSGRAVPIGPDPDTVLLDAGGQAYLGEFALGIGERRLEQTDSTTMRELARLVDFALTGDDGTDRTSAGGRARRPSAVDQVLTCARTASGGVDSLSRFLAAWHDAVDPVGVRRPTGVEAGPNPYLGLRAFDESDVDAFHGRDDVVDELCRRTCSTRFVAVVGPSGSGKSSVVRAGVAARLKASGAVVVTMTPGDRPVRSLADSISTVATSRDATIGPGAATPITADVVVGVAHTLGRLVIVVDQFEECWTRGTAADRSEFVDLIGTLVDTDDADVRVLVTIRADLLDRPLADPTLGPRLGSGAFVLGPMSPAQIRSAIERPAADAGVDVAGEVVDDLMAASSSQPGFLPLLQFTLTELFDRREGTCIDRATLASIGGVAGAIGRRAESIFDGLPPLEQAATRELFGRLVIPGERVPDIRRRTASSELSAPMLAVAERYVDGRLLVTDRDPTTREPTFEVAHEALFTGWPRLRRWIEEDRRWLLQLQHLTAAARQWDEVGRPDAELYRGARLEAAVEAIDAEHRPVPDLAATFLADSRRHRQRERDAERRRVRRLRAVVAATSVLAAVALTLGAVAVVQRNTARRAQVAEQAANREAAIEALVGRSESLRTTQRDVAALLAIEAYRLDDTPRTRSALLATFTDDERFLDAHWLGGEGGRAGVVLPDGRSAYVSDEAGRLHPYDLDSGKVEDPLPEVGPAGRDAFPVLAASPDGSMLVVAVRTDPRDGPSVVGVVDLTGRRLRFEPVAVTGAVTAATFLADDRVALVTGENGRLLVIDATTGATSSPARSARVAPDDIIWTPEPGDARGRAALRRPSSVALDGDRLLVGASDGTIRVIDASTVDVIATIHAPPEGVSSLIPLGDGSVIASGRQSVARLRLDDGGTSWIEHDLDGCLNVAVVAERDAVFCGDPYGRLSERDVATGAIRRQLDAQHGNSGSLWSAAGGAELVSIGRSQPIVSRWRLDGSGPITSMTPPRWTPLGFDDDTGLLLVDTGGVDSEDYTAGLVDPGDSASVTPLDGLLAPEWVGSGELLGGALDRDGRIEYARVDVTASDATEPELTGVVVDHVDQFIDLTAAPGKRSLIVRYRDGDRNWLTAVDPSSLETGARIEVPGFMEFAADRAGDRIAAGTSNGVVLYDAAGGDEIGRLGGSEERAAAITPADQLLVGSTGGELTMYDLDSLEPEQTFDGNRGLMFGASSTEDGSLIAVTTGDRTASLFDVATGIRLGDPIPIAVGDRGSNAPWLSLDGRWLALRSESAPGAERIQIWDLDPQHWIDAACRLAGRNLTEAEWDTDIGELEPYRRTCEESRSTS